MKTVVIIDDDVRLRQTLERRFNHTSGFRAVSFASPQQAEMSGENNAFAVFLDLMLENCIGLDSISMLNERFHPQHLIMMTGYASIATTVSAIKKGATDYIAKPVSFNSIINMLTPNPVACAQVSSEPLTTAQVEWEHIQRVLFENGGYQKCDYTILVTAPKHLRIQRIQQRDASSEEAIKDRMDNQWPDSKKIPLADFVIENITLSKTKNRVEHIHKILLEV